MQNSGLSALTDLAADMASHVGGRLVQIVLSPATFSLASLLCALCIAMVFIGLKRQRRRPPMRPKALLRALFPRRLLRSASSRADIGYFVFNAFLAGLLIGWAVVSYHYVSTAANGLLVSAVGARQPTALPAWQAGFVLTLALFLAYELSYYVDHYLSHNVPLLWEFHKVHHSAEVLSPLTNFRVHPVDTLVFNNISALIMGAIGGLLNFTFGQPTHEFTVANSNIIVLTGAYLVGHLQHTHFWIAFTGFWGRVLLSPAHHQVHHSTNPAHFNKNLGSTLGLFDWLFGTLYVPGRDREKLTFGVEPTAAEVHSVTQGVIAPVGRAWALLVAAWRLRPRPRRAPTRVAS